MTGQLPSATARYRQNSEQIARRIEENRAGDLARQIARATTSDGSISVGSGSVTLANGTNNNVAIDHAVYNRVSGPTAAFTITGLTAGERGRVAVLRNATSYVMTIAHQSASSAEANRIVTPASADLAVKAGYSVLLIYDATSARWVVVTLPDLLGGLADPNADQVVFWDDSAGGFSLLALGGGLVITGTTITGRVIQVASASYATSATVDETPFDDTIPQNTEGTEIMTAAITPLSTTNKLRIDVLVPVGPQGVSDELAVVALHQDSTASALAAAVSPAFDGTLSVCALSHVMDAGTTSSTTFKVRVGSVGSDDQVRVNGYNGSRVLGGVMKATMIITEYVP